MTARDLFNELQPGDLEGAEEVVHACIEEHGDISPELTRTLAIMQEDPIAFLTRVDEIKAETDPESVLALLR
jgi:hypothetical protein